MSVHYKFKSTLDYDTITFDGLNISVADLKKAILQQKRLSKITDFDLQIINAQTKEEYQHDSSLIPKNTSLIISRVPLTNQTKKQWDAAAKPVPARAPTKVVENADFDLSKMEGSEEDKIQAMMMQSTAEYDPKSYQKIRGYTQTGEVPSSYRCNKCKKGGHWIKNCPFIITKEHVVEKRTTGIPKSFRDTDRAMMENQEPAVEEEKKQEIPEDLICGICNDLFVDAVMIPCCGSSFCDDCVRTALLESEDNECPDCKEKGSSPGSLIPNRFLRNSVNAFKNRTGYKACSQAKKEPPIEPAEVKPNDVPKKEENDVELPPSTTATTTPPPKEEADLDIPEEKTNSPEPESKDEEKPDETELINEKPLEEEPAVVKEDDSKDEDTKPLAAVQNTSPAHEDSDYEDNIVVKVPSASDTRTEKYLSRRHASHPKPPGIEQSSPKSKHQASPYQQENSSHRSNESSSGSNNKDWDHSSRNDNGRGEHHDSGNNEHYMYDKNRNMPPSSKPMDNVQPPGANSVQVPLYPPHQQPYDMQRRPIRPMNMHPGFHSHMHRPPLYPHPNMQPHHPQQHQLRMPMPAMQSYDPGYNPIGQVAPGYPRFPSSNMPNRFNYPIREPENPNQMRPFNNIASVYEEVAAKVGVGIIDDPLEAFNRIMKEKEKKKDERRSPDRRRRSKERNVRGNFRTSPYHNRMAKDHGGGYHDNKRGRSRERENDRRWPRYGGKVMDKERERDRDRDRERERDRDRDNHQGYRPRRSKSLERSSRSRSLSPPTKRYNRSPPNTKPHNVHERHPQQHYQQKPRMDDHDDGFHSHRQKRATSRNLPNSSKSFDSRGPPRQHMDHEDKDLELRKPFNMNDENMEPPPPGFEMQQPSRNPFHSNNTLSPPPNSSGRDRDRPMRNITPDLYEKCVSQDLEENKLYNMGNKTDQRSGSRSGTRSRSRSRSSLRVNDKRRKLHRSTTPKGKPSDSQTKRDKENQLSSSSSHGHSKHKSDDHHRKKDKELNHEHESKRRSMTPPRLMSDHQQHTTPETDHKERKDKSEKKMKERKKRRKEKSERKKVKKEKKAKKERHRQKSEEEKETTTKEDEEEEADHNVSATSLDMEKTPIDPEMDLKKPEAADLEEEGEYHSVEKEFPANSTPKTELNGGSLPPTETTPKQQQQQTLEYGEKTPPSDIKCFDAVLDIHEYETDFDDNSFKLQDNANNKLVPEASKWELEDPTNAAGLFGEEKAEGKPLQINNDNKVTNDVLVRAEKAIFARAINAIRPLEVTSKKSLSKERSSKPYGDDHENIRNIQITLPVNISKERSIEVRNESSEKKKSIKERLGSKINQPIFSQVADSRRETDHAYKSSYNNEREMEHEKRNKGGNETKNSSKRNESDRNNRDHRQGKERENNRDPEKDKERERDREKERGRDKDRVRHRDNNNGDKSRDHDKEKNRARTKDRERERERDRGHEHNTAANRSNSLQSKSKDHKLSKTDKTQHSTEKDRDREREKERERERDRNRDNENLTRKRHQSQSSPIPPRKRSLSSSNSDSDDGDRKKKIAKADKKSRKRSESPADSDNGKKSSKKKNKSDKKKKKKSKK